MKNREARAGGRGSGTYQDTIHNARKYSGLVTHLVVSYIEFIGFSVIRNSQRTSYLTRSNFLGVAQPSPPPIPRTLDMPHCVIQYSVSHFPITPPNGLSVLLIGSYDLIGRRCYRRIGVQLDRSVFIHHRARKYPRSWLLRNRNRNAWKNLRTRKRGIGGGLWKSGWASWFP